MHVSPSIGERSSKWVILTSLALLARLNLVALPSYIFAFWGARRARPREVKYGWRSGNTTYFEDRRFEGTVAFDGRMKPNFVKVETTLALFAHLSL